MLPIFFGLIFTQVEMARLGMVSQLLPLAAREGARVAILYGKTQADVEHAVGNVLANSGIPVGTVAVTPSGWATAANATPIKVALSVPYSRVSWLSTPKYLGSKIITASATLNSERP